MPQPPPGAGYRPDIEGLRGIAILLVVAFHAGVTVLAGGFVGVDVFFVLSGFFITAMLARELEYQGDVDVNAFYTRRALRLVPAMLLVLLATLAAVFLLYAPIDRGWIASDARAVALHAGNMNFARGAVDYFSTGDNPLLHTWSLAVEEQFRQHRPCASSSHLPTPPGIFGDAAAMKNRLRSTNSPAVRHAAASAAITTGSVPIVIAGDSRSTCADSQKGRPRPPTAPSKNRS